MSWMDKYGIEIEAPRPSPPPLKIHEMRATILFWHYMSLAGIPLRDIAACFEVSYPLVHKYISEIPDDIKDSYASDDFVGRLRAAFPEGRRPKSYAEIRIFMQAARPDDVQGHSSVSDL